MIFFPGHRGAVLIEAIVAIAIFSLVIPAILNLSLGSLKEAADNMNRFQALLLAQEGLEASRSIRDYSWNVFTDGVHGLTDSNGYWEWSGSSDIDSGYIRQVTVVPVDSDTKEVTSRTDAPTGFSVSLKTTLTRWKYSDWKQTTSADFNLGTRSNVVVTATGDGEIKLSTGASFGTFISSAFNTGSYTPRYQTIFWTRSGIGNLKFQVRTAETQAGLGGAVWVGPDGRSASFYTVSNTPIALDPGRSGDQWAQYMATLEGDGTNSPVLESITVRYVP